MLLQQVRLHGRYISSYCMLYIELNALLSVFLLICLLQTRCYEEVIDYKKKCGFCNGPGIINLWIN